MELLTRWLIVARRRWPVILVCLAAAAVVASLFQATSARAYTASTELFLRAPDVTTSAGAYQGDLFSRQRAQTYVNMFGSDELAQLVIDRLGLTESPEELVSHVSAEAVADTVLMVISVTDPDAQRAANIANGYGAVLNDYVARLENVENNPDIPPLVQVVNRASASDATASGNPAWLVLTAALVVALLIAVGWIWFLEHFDTKLRSRADVERVTGGRVIGKFPKNRRLKSGGDPRVVFDEVPDLKQAAQRLSVNVESMLQRESGVRGTPVVAVVAPALGDGATVVAALLARAFESRGRQAVLVVPPADAAEPREPVLANAGPAANPESKDPSRFVLPDRPVTPERLDEALDAVRADADIVLIDSPPFNESVDAQVVVANANAVLMVVRPSSTDTRRLQDMIAGLKILQRPVIGVVVTAATESATLAGHYR